MCGRVLQSSGPLRFASVEALNVSDSRMGNIRPCYNAAPSRELLVIRENHTDLANRGTGNEPQLWLVDGDRSNFGVRPLFFFVGPATDVVGRSYRPIEPSELTGSKGSRGGNQWLSRQSTTMKGHRSIVPMPPNTMGKQQSIMRPDITQRRHTTLTPQGYTRVAPKCTLKRPRS
jgi:hypothetical protein